MKKDYCRTDACGGTSNAREIQRCPIHAAAAADDEAKNHGERLKDTVSKSCTSLLIRHTRDSEIPNRQAVILQVGGLGFTPLFLQSQHDPTIKSMQKFHEELHNSRPQLIVAPHLSWLLCRPTLVQPRCSILCPFAPALKENYPFFRIRRFQWGVLDVHAVILCCRLLVFVKDNLDDIESPRTTRERVP